VKEKEIKLNPGDGGSYYYAYYFNDNERSIKKNLQAIYFLLLKLNKLNKGEG
jgi:hypothetical protein